MATLVDSAKCAIRIFLFLIGACSERRSIALESSRRVDFGCSHDYPSVFVLTIDLFDIAMGIDDYPSSHFGRSDCADSCNVSSDVPLDVVGRAFPKSMARLLHDRFSARRYILFHTAVDGRSSELAILDIPSRLLCDTAAFTANALACNFCRTDDASSFSGKISN